MNRWRLFHHFYLLNFEIDKNCLFIHQSNKAKKCNGLTIQYVCVYIYIYPYIYIYIVPVISWDYQKQNTQNSSNFHGRKYDSHKMN